MHARHNIYFSLAGGIALILVSLYSLWATRRGVALELKQVELEHLARLGTMSAVLAHEIRNPLGTIKGFAQLALEQAGAKEHSLLGPFRSDAPPGEPGERPAGYGRPPAPQFAQCLGPTLGPLSSHTAALIGNARSISVSNAAFDVETDPDAVGQSV